MSQNDSNAGDRVELSLLEHRAVTGAVELFNLTATIATALPDQQVAVRSIKGGISFLK